MTRAYKVKSGSVGTPVKPDTRAYQVMMAEDMAALFERLVHGAFPAALRDEELHIAPLGEVK